MTFRDFALTLIVVFLMSSHVSSAPVRVRFVEGVTHGFLVLRTSDGRLIASGDQLQVSRDKHVESRILFRFKDGSVFDERVVFTQQQVFAMQTYQLVQRGPSFEEDNEISLKHASGQYRIKSKAKKDGQEQVFEGTLEVPPDCYTGMLVTVAKNLPKGTTATVHIVVFTPKPRILKLELAPAGEQQVLIGGVAKNTTHYLLKPQLGTLLKLVSKVAGRTPPDSHAWILNGDVPAFVRFEGPLYAKGPLWRIELASPHWPG